MPYFHTRFASSLVTFTGERRVFAVWAQAMTFRSFVWVALAAGNACKQEQ